MPASSNASLATVEATDCPAAMPPPTRLSSIAGIDRLRRTAPCDPHRDVVAAADETIDVRRVGADAEVARRRALEHEPWRGAELRGDSVAFVAPRGQEPVGARAARDPCRSPSFAKPPRRGRTRTQCDRRTHRRHRGNARAGQRARRRPSRLPHRRRGMAAAGTMAARARARAAHGSRRASHSESSGDCSVEAVARGQANGSSRRVTGGIG